MAQVCAAAALATSSMLSSGTPARQCLTLLYVAMEAHNQQGPQASPQALQVRP